MTSSVHLADQAAQAAEDAAARARVDVRELDDVQALSDADELFRTIWGPSDRNLVGVAVLRALSHSGNYVVGAFDGSQLVGALVGFLGRKSGALQLHSHILGVVPDIQGRRVGFALKEDQRAWALARGISTVTWTFDPLVRRNAYFNITRLGATVTRYYANFYGDMDDDINGRDESDRVLIEWRLSSKRAVAASTRELAAPDVMALRSSGALEALDIGDDGEPVRAETSADKMLIRVPEDIVALRRNDEGLAHRWRLAVRDVLGSALSSDYSTVGMTRSGYYVVTR